MDFLTNRLKQQAETIQRAISTADIAAVKQRWDLNIVWMKTSSVVRLKQV